MEFYFRGLGTVRYSGILSKVLLILVMFSLVVHPQVEVFAITAPPQAEANSEEITELLAKKDLLFSYDDIIGLLAAVENDELEKRGNLDEILMVDGILNMLWSVWLPIRLRLWQN